MCPYHRIDVDKLKLKLHSVILLSQSRDSFPSLVGAASYFSVVLPFVDEICNSELHYSDHVNMCRVSPTFFCAVFSLSSIQLNPDRSLWLIWRFGLMPWVAIPGDQMGIIYAQRSDRSHRIKFMGQIMGFLEVILSLHALESSEDNISFYIWMVLTFNFQNQIMYFSFSREIVTTSFRNVLC